MNIWNDISITTRFFFKYKFHDVQFYKWRKHEYLEKSCHFRLLRNVITYCCIEYILPLQEPNYKSILSNNKYVFYRNTLLFTSDTTHPIQNLVSYMYVIQEVHQPELLSWRRHFRILYYNILNFCFTLHWLIDRLEFIVKFYNILRYIVAVYYWRGLCH
jgi:hypothetical protein